jgi:tyrosine-protein phosphatase SIW14
MASRWQFGLGAAAAAVIVAVPWVYSEHRKGTIRNLRVVEEGVLYRSGQLSPEGLDQVIRERGIRTVISLRAAREDSDPHPDAWEEEFCESRGLNHFRIIPRIWGPDKRGYTPADKNVKKFLAIMDDEDNHPALVHCFAGIHRTGALCAIFRMEYHRWPAERAIREMQLCGFDPLDMQQHIEPYLRGYRPRWESADTR